MPTSTIWEPFTVTITVTTSLPTPPPSTSTTSSPTPSSTPSPSSSSTTCPRQTLTLTAPPKTTTTTYTTILTSTTSIFNFTADCVGQTCQTPYTLYPCPDTSLDSCYCGFDSSGYSYCFVNDFCQNQTDCSFNEDCKEGERCVVASCCGVGKCTKTAMGRCVNPASVVVESLEGVIEGVNAVRNGCSNVNPGGCE
ncbi:hypothetical protein QBC44DRAFT_387041 [Cladorrhinum sp. PSN332]|nr:hypothetical protein QBC44DRAFT_387041 [Cladorrhinum sp. PSN332]